MWDLVSALNVIDEVNDSAALLEEIKSLPSSRGSVVIATPFKPSNRRTRGISSTQTPSDDGFALIHAESDIPWVVIRGPRYLEMLSVDLYEYRPARSSRARLQEVRAP